MRFWGAGRDPEWTLVRGFLVPNRAAVVPNGQNLKLQATQGHPPSGRPWRLREARPAQHTGLDTGHGAWPGHLLPQPEPLYFVLLVCL